ncbi:MAG TPA: tetratricopeptide repeat protein [Rhizomicrobium sp.]|jgi:tetratricopeptide (TPR) repeat protein|nr:tetratricopeptide repeat protein [Rhizomicrobium sp.]
MKFSAAGMVIAATLTFATYAHAQMGTGWMLDKAVSPAQIECDGSLRPGLRVTVCTASLRRSTSEHAVDILTVRASGYEGLEQYDKAIQDYDRILAIDPGNEFATRSRCKDNAYLNGLGDSAGVQCGDVKNTKTSNQ